MTNKKSTKRALYSSVLSLVLCMAMLIGTTFAWFTDSVTSANNKIESGSLKIDLLVKDDAGVYQSIKESKEPIFNSSLWEPGYTEYVNVKVANTGSLALKYMLKVVPKTTVSILADVIDVYFISGDVTPTRDSLATLTPVGTLRDVVESTDPDGYLHGELLANDNVEGSGKDEAYATIALKMRETAGNQYQDLTFGEFDINLVATQLMHEPDSFGPDYDKDATYEERVEVTADNFADALASIKDSGYDAVRIVLAEDVSWETGAAHGSTPWIDAAATVSKVTIEGNGHAVTATGDGVGPIRAANGATLVFEDVKFVDKSESYAEGSWEFGYLEFEGNLEFVECTFVNAIMFEGDSAMFTNCSFNSNASNEYDAWVSNGIATFVGCTFEGYRGLKMHEAYGSEIATVVVDNCDFGPLSKKPGVAIGTLNENTSVTIKNSNFVDCQPGDQNKYIYESDTDVTTFSFLIENNTVVTETNVIQIATAEELFDFAKQVNDGNSMSGKLVKLTGNINLEGKVWTPIGQTGATQFLGVFDGANYTISNLKVDSSAQTGKHYSSGLFGWAQGKIKNVNVKGAEVIGHHNVGVIAGALESCQVINCHVYNATISCTMANDDANGDKAGGICGILTADADRVINCSVSNSTISAGRDAGQVVGAATAGKYVNVIDCFATNVTVNANGTSTGANINNEIIGRK